MSEEMEEMSFFDWSKPLTYHKGKYRDYCSVCRKMFREGQLYISRPHPVPFRREHRWEQKHYPECPSSMPVHGSP